MVKQPKKKNRGFTLPEILVSITLVAVLAAVVVPTIAGQVKKGDPARVGNDFLALRGAVEQFLSDVRRYPKSLGQLTNTITSGQSSLVGANYGAAEATRWRGPYLTKDSLSADSTGFGVAFRTPFDTLSLPVSGVTRAAGITYLIVSLVGVDTASAASVDGMFDDGSPVRGSVRWSKGATGFDTLKFLAVPIH